MAAAYSRVKSSFVQPLYRLLMCSLVQRVDALLEFVPLAVEILSVGPAKDPECPSHVSRLLVSQVLEDLSALSLLSEEASDEILDVDDSRQETKGTKNPDDVFHGSSFQSGSVQESSSSTIRGDTRLLSTVKGTMRLSPPARKGTTRLLRLSSLP